MNAPIRWLAADSINEARIAGYMDGWAGAAAALRSAAAREPPDRERERDVLLAVAAGFDDAIG